MTTPPSEALIEAAAREVITKYVTKNWGGIGADEHADAITKALAEAGLVVVPREPTREMLHASTMIAPTWDDEISLSKWTAMLDAAALRQAEGGAG